MRFLRAFLLVVLGFPFPAASAALAADAGFELRDALGRHWRNESVAFPLSPGQLESARARHALVGPDDKPVPYQLVAGDGAAPRIEFLAELRPFEARTYRFAPSAAAAPGDIRIEETSGVIRLYNSRVGFAVRKRLAAGEGPIESIRLNSGRWMGDSRLKGEAVTAYSARVVAHGPAFAEVLCRLTLGAHGSWELRLRLNANEPVVLVDETFAAGGASFELLLNRNFPADTLFHRNGSGTPGDANSVGRLATWKIEPSVKEPLFVVEPWLRWWERQRQGTWFGLYQDNEKDLLAIGARDAAVWVDPAQKPETRAAVKAPLTQDGADLKWALSLKNGARRWMIAALDTGTSLEPLKAKNRHVAPLPQQYLTKHGDFPLNRVKDYVLSWPEGAPEHPRLMVTQADVARWRARFRADASITARLVKSPVYPHTLDEAIGYYLGTEDPALGAYLAATAVRWMQDAVDMFLHQDALVTLGFAPHHQRAILGAVNLADAVGSSRHVTPSLRARLKAQAAFLAYTVNREDYWSPERGYAANPNMTTMVAAYQTILASAIREHPLAAAWAAKGLRELKQGQLESWSDENGGWLEAPHYALVSYDYMLGAFLAARNAGLGDHVFEPKMRKVIEWLAKIATPPDSAYGGYRHQPPIGNTYVREPSGEFGIVAYLWKDRDPQFSSEMQWMYRQQGAYPAPGIGGAFPALAGYRNLLTDGALPEKAPAYRSEWFPKTGVVLRDAFPSARETQLHLIAGGNHSHYDRDSGSVTLWGKGRIVANDFGYYGQAPGDDHSMLVSRAAADGAIMHVKDFAAGDRVDYVRGVKSDAWTRQIAFIKDPDPLGPAYFVFSDSVRDGAGAMWRTWFDARKVTPAPQGALVEGREDVDTEVFFARPNGVTAAIEDKTRESWGLTGGKYGRVSTTQTGLVVALGATDLTTVIYPRLKTQARPVFASVADGNGVRVETEAGTDYVFLANRPFAYRDGAVAFEGTVGAVLSRGGRKLLWLGQPGAVSADGRRLQCPAKPGGSTTCATQ